MSRNYRLENFSINEYYLERAVPNLENTEEDIIPIPGSFTNTMKYIEDYEKNSDYLKLDKSILQTGLLSFLALTL